MWGERTIKRALASLVRKGFIERVHSYHPFKSGIMRACWLRALDFPNGVKTAQSIGPKLPNQSGQNGLTLIQEDEQEELHEVHGDKSPGEKSSKKKSGEVTKIPKLADKSPEDIKASFKAKPPRTDKKLTAGDLFKFLRHVQQDANPAHPFGDPTGWNIGNCKTILKRLRGENLSDDQIREHLEFLLMNWGEFKDYMVTHANKKLPWYATIPVITTNTTHGLLFVELRKEYENASPDDNNGFMTEEEALAKLHSED